MARIGNLFNPNRINLGEKIPLDTPLVIQLEASGYCNLKCVFCPCGQDSGIIRDTLTPETFDRFISQCLEFPDKIKVLRIIGIGEPLLNPNIADFVAKAKRCGAFERVEITTNGVLLTPELSDRLVDSGLDALLISLEATDEGRFQKVAGVKVDLERMYQNLKYFFEHRRGCILYIKTVDVALDTEGDRAAFLSKYGQICDEIQIEHVYENWPEFKAGTGGDSVRYDMDLYRTKKQVCVQPFKLLCLAANGDVMPCCVDWKRKLILGNLGETTLVKIWNGEALRRLRISLLKGQLCDFCDRGSYLL